MTIDSGFAVEGLEVILDGVGGQSQAPRDLLDEMALEEKVQDVLLAWGEIVPGGDGRQQLIGSGRLHYDGHPPTTERAGGQGEPAARLGADPGEPVGPRAACHAGGGRRHPQRIGQRILGGQLSADGQIAEPGGRLGADGLGGVVRADDDHAGGQRWWWLPARLHADSFDGPGERLGDRRGGGGLLVAERGPAAFAEQHQGTPQGAVRR